MEGTQDHAARNTIASAWFALYTNPLATTVPVRVEIGVQPKNQRLDPLIRELRALIPSSE